MTGLSGSVLLRVRGSRKNEFVAVLRAVEDKLALSQDIKPDQQLLIQDFWYGVDPDFDRIGWIVQIPTKLQFEMVDSTLDRTRCCGQFDLPDWFEQESAYCGLPYTRHHGSSVNDAACLKGERHDALL